MESHLKATRAKKPTNWLGIRRMYAWSQQTPFIGSYYMHKTKPLVRKLWKRKKEKRHIRWTDVSWDGIKFSQAFQLVLGQNFESF